MASKNQTNKRDNTHITESRGSKYHLHQVTRITTNKPCSRHAAHGPVWWDGHCSSGYFPQITRKHQTAKIRSEPTKYLISPPKCQKQQRLSCSRPEGINETRQLLGKGEANQDWVLEPKGTRVENGWNMNQVHNAVQGPAPMLISQLQ